jgi:hypothetical protein
MIEFWHLPLLFGTAMAAGFVDSIAGGGGLITIPVLMSLGLSPTDALGTNQLQASFGSGSAAWHHIQAGTVSIQECVFGFLVTVASAAAGAWLVRQVDPAFLRRAIPALLLLVAAYMIFKPRIGETEIAPRMKRGLFHLIFGIALGFYDGFFGPGTGTFWAMAYMLGLGYNMTRATGYTKIMNFGSNISALALFLLGGNVLFGAGLIMGAGQWFGARLGSRMVIAKGAHFIRPIFLSVVLALALKLLWD